MIKFVPPDLLNTINNKFITYFNHYLIKSHSDTDQVIYNGHTIYLVFNLNNPNPSNCRAYYYQNNQYFTLNINAGEDLSPIKNYLFTSSKVKSIVLEYYYHIIAHELLHYLQFTNPNKYLPYKKINSHQSHELRDIEFYPNMINYQYEAKDNLKYFIDHNPELNNIKNNDYNRYKKIVKILYKEQHG